MPLPNSIDAPYNFVPLADWVYLPDWATRVSHDLPFRDGLCGHLDLTLTAHSPILVGREQVSATEDAPGEVEPYQLPDGRYALPGTALKGMIRNVVEIATFSRMGAVDDNRYGLRDISRGGYVSASYTDRVRNAVKTGFMRLGSDGLPTITPCAMVRLSHRTLEKWLEKPAPIFPAERAVSAKYRLWKKICDEKDQDSQQIRFSIDDGHAVDLGSGTLEGTPVFTGQISKSTDKHGKKRDFVFYNEDPASAFPLSPRDWGDFLFVHGDQATRDAADMSWPGYWKQHFWDGDAVPVFYLRDRAKTRVGLAFMPRLAGDFSTREMIAHTAPQHLDGQGRGPWDLAELLFGTVGDRSDACLKGRITFQHAIANTDERPPANAPTILNGPKASYFPNYLRQSADQSSWKLKSRGYATYLGTGENPKPEIRGWKRYPSRPQAHLQPLTDEQRRNTRVQVILHPLPAGTVFHCRLDLHNLRPVEFGALCWALTWGGTPGSRHSLGMGKPFGLGQLSIEIERADLRPNAADTSPLLWQQYRDAFITHMETVASAQRCVWRRSPQIETLLGMASPENEVRFKGTLKHMVLEPKKKTNEFMDAKGFGLALADYPGTEHPPTWAELETEREEQERQRAAERAEVERQAREAQRLAEEKAAFDALPAECQLIVTTQERVEDFLILGETEQRARRDDLVAVLNALFKAAESWTDHALRIDAADVLEHAYDNIGWWDPGQNKKQREKKEDKRRKQIEQLRMPSPQH